MLQVSVSKVMRKVTWVSHIVLLVLKPPVHVGINGFRLREIGSAALLGDEYRNTLHADFPPGDVVVNTDAAVGNGFIRLGTGAVRLVQLLGPCDYLSRQRRILDSRIVRIRRVIALEHLVFDGGQRHIAANQRIEFADTLARRLYRISGSLRKFRNLEYIERQALELRRSQQPVILFEGRRGEFDVQVGGLQLGHRCAGARHLGDDLLHELQFIGSSVLGHDVPGGILPLFDRIYRTARQYHCTCRCHKE